MNIFGGNTDVTYDQLQRRKKMAEQLMNPGTPRNVGEGLSAIGKALIGRAVEKKTNRQETAMRDQFNERFGQVAGKQAQAMADLYGNPMASDMQKQILGALMKKGVPGMSRGGIARGGMTVVGEAGPELVKLPKGARVAQVDPLEEELDSYMEQYKTPNDAPPEVLQRMDEIMRALNPPKTEQKPINTDNFYRNEREQRDPNYDPAMENFYRNEREQRDPMMDREMEFLKEGRFDDANAYQVADLDAFKLMQLEPEYADPVAADINTTEGGRLSLLRRMMFADAALEDPRLAEAMTRLDNSIAGKFGTLGRYYTGDEYELGKLMADQFANAVLRNDSGAQAPEPEVQRYIGQYFPLPGEGPQQLQAKKAMRREVIRSLMQALGGDAAPAVKQLVSEIEDLKRQADTEPQISEEDRKFLESLGIK